jgi:hypothetical protein
VRNSSDANSDFAKTFYKAAKEFKGDIMFVISDIAEGA